MCKCCFGNNENESCGWPKGTVRALMALLIVPFIVIISGIMCIMLFAFNQTETALGILSGLTGICGSIVGYYYGTRTAQGNTENLMEMEKQILNNNQLTVARLRDIEMGYVARERN